MKPFTSVKARITLWYTALMLLIISIVLISVAALSLRLSMDNIENSVKAQVTQIAEKVKSRISKSTAFTLENNEEFKNVSIYSDKGSYVIGQYNYDVSNIPFKNEFLRKESINGETYIVYDIFKPAAPGKPGGYWIRGAESVAYTKILGRSVFMIILIVIPFILILTAWGGYYITKKAFFPIDNIINTANEICLSNNITKRIPLNANMQKDELYRLSVTLNDMLDRIEKLILQEKQFTSDASHELRTPISVILAQGEYLLDIAESIKEKELSQDIVTKAKQMSRLVSSLLLLARIDQNRQKFNREKTDINVVIDIAIQSVSKFAESKNITLLSDINCQVLIYADEVLLTTAVTNLINNAVKYGKEGGYVMITAIVNSDNTEIRITDNGIGIPENKIDKIWTRFYRIDNVRNDEYGSCGLGLALVKSIITLHGGDISVTSTLDSGTELSLIHI